MNEKFLAEKTKTVDNKAPVIDPLVLRAMDGDTAAFSELYIQHFKNIYGVFFKIVKNPATAEDLTQELFIKLPKVIKSFKGQSAFSTWLHKIAKNDGLMYLRNSSTKKRGKEITAEQDVLDDLINSFTDSVKYDQEEMKMINRIEKERIIKKMRRAIEQLKPIYKNVLLLVLEDLGETEIAQKLGISLAAAKARRHEAKLELRKLLSHD